MRFLSGTIHISFSSYFILCFFNFGELKSTSISLDDTTVAVQATSCYVLEMFCERLEPEAVRPLLDSLVKKLATMLEGSTKRSVQEMAVAALAATAVAAEEEFTPYVGGVAALMSKCMALEDETMFSLRGRALECMGHMAIAVGRETFRPYFQVTMECACNGLTRDSTDLHEFAYAVFANLSKVMKEEFAPACQAKCRTYVRYSTHVITYVRT